MTDRRTVLRSIAALAGLAVLVYAEVFLRRNLEHADRFLYSFLEYFYSPFLDAIFARPWWRLLLPIRELTGAWSASIIITHLTELRIGVANTWYLFNALLVVVSFAAAWLVCDSLAFAYTFAICMGFGTHFFHTYAVTGGMASPLIACVMEIAIACAYRFVVAERRPAWWGAAFGVALLACALSYEGWLDAAVFGCAATFLFAVFAWRHQATRTAWRLLMVGVAVTVVAAVYVQLKVKLGYGQVEGGESDVIFNYQQWSPFLEDLGSNIITHVYMAVTNFLPPMLTSSTALYELGADNLVILQHNYHSPFTYLVPMHYLFLWRYAAGALTLGLGLVTLKLIARAWKQPSADVFAGLSGLLMVWFAGSTHALIKIRPMKVAPVMGYHVLVGVVGVAFLISYAVFMVWRGWRSTTLRVAVTACVWAVLFYGALARPLMLSHLAAQVGLGPGLYPDPMATLLQMFGKSRAKPSGLRPYQLMKRPASIGTDPPVLPILSDLPALPLVAPDAMKWNRGLDVVVSPAGDSFLITGSTLGAYQLTSPKIPVLPHHQLLVRTDGTMDRGNVCLGILDSQQSWLKPPEPGVKEVSVDTGANEVVQFVFSTCAAEGEIEAPQFHIKSVTYALLMTPDEVRR